MFPFTISPSVSDLVLKAEENGDTYLEFEAWNQSDSTRGRVRIRFERCLGARMCCMSGEAGFGIGILSSSKWLDELHQNQRKYYPEYSDNFKDIKHYYFRGHDSSVEVLAENVSFEIVNEFGP